MTELPASSDIDTIAPARRTLLAPAVEAPSDRPPVGDPSAHLAASLTDLSYMIIRVHTIRSRGRFDRDLDWRLAGVIAELESLIHDLLHGARPATNGARRPPTRVAPSAVADGSGLTGMEAALVAWLTSQDKPDVWQVDGPDEPPTSMTAILGALLLSRRQLPTDAADVLSMAPGTALGSAAADLLLAVNDPAGPRCRSYRSAVYYLREHVDECPGSKAIT